MTFLETRNLLCSSSLLLIEILPVCVAIYLYAHIAHCPNSSAKGVIKSQVNLLHFVSFFHVASLFSTGVDKTRILLCSSSLLLIEILPVCVAIYLYAQIAHCPNSSAKEVIKSQVNLLHFVAFFHVASLFSIGVDNEKALELDIGIIFSNFSLISM